MHEPARLIIHEFEAAAPLPHLKQAGPQEQYIRVYLRDLGAQSILEEPHYFDRDYLSEFEGYYATSARGYLNVCKRLHFFSVPLDRAKLRRALDGNSRSLKALREAYLGFCVVRPLPASPFGKTVLRWYPELDPAFPRVTESRRTYTCHIAGVPFTVEGLAWQQQDSSVSACATVALWSMLHSSAFSESHSVPTTYEITNAANQTFGYGRRAFPSSGLTADQLGEVIKTMSLQPARVESDQIYCDPEGSQHQCFHPQRFSPIVCGLLRSGYPILLIGSLWETDDQGGLVAFLGLHAVCLSGFREPKARPTSGWGFQDEFLEHVYLHDDNQGPNVRYRVDHEPLTAGASQNFIILRRSPPQRIQSSITENTGARFALIPSDLFVAVHDAIRVDILSLFRRATDLSSVFDQIHRHLLKQKQAAPTSASTTVSLRFVELNHYMGQELSKMSGRTASLSTVLGSTRLSLAERIAPMSKHIGLIRIASDGEPVVDFLFDTTEIERSARCFSHVLFDTRVHPIVDILAMHRDIGVRVEAF
ncbi:MAG: hypothetical protein H0U74_17620 [Bradymonadaceae bacterium]|nr:hypothetical protein [Lujinxingiaceae bacterium]